MRGTHPRISEDPNEKRIITWRISATLHTLLMKVTRKRNISSNRLITNVMTKKLQELEEQDNLKDVSD